MRHFAENELKITRLRNGGGNGGQNKNKVETAIRLEHVPTGIVITANTERSQKDNLREALRRLEEQLAANESRRRAAAAKAKWEARDRNGFSADNRIRSYFFVKEQVARDHRSGIELPIDDVMGGRLDEFLMAALVEESCATTLDKGNTAD